jgi:excisionase family DNA binding protein
MTNECPRCGWGGGLKPRQAAELLGVSHQTVRSMVKDGTLPGVETERRQGGWHYWIPVEVIAARIGGTVEPDPASLRNCPRCGHRSAMLPKEAAETIGVAEQTVRNWIESGKLQADVETASGFGGRQLWIPLEEVQRAYREKQEKEAKKAVGV